METFKPLAILRETEAIYQRLLEIRHHLHRYPELSFHEEGTQRYLAEQLRGLRPDDLTEVARTGLLARMEGAGPGPVIVLRADMDALPITEENDVPYRSEVEGVMHACGHDVHMTCLLGAATLLGKWRHRWQGTVLFLFQPAEESLPGGAKEIVESGILDRHHASLVAGQHVDPTLPAGTVGYRPGPYMASSDELYLTVSGKGGHAALPAAVTNTPYIAARTLTTLEDFVEENTPGDFPSVLRFGKVVANGATNIIPPEVKMEGTFRAFDESWRENAHKKLQEITATIAREHHGRADLEIRKGYPVLVNDEKAVALARSFSEEMLGKNNVRALDLRMTAEDFAYYSQRYPALFFRLGVAPPGRDEVPPLHSPRFDIHEPALITGAAHLTWLTLSFLQRW